MTTTLRIVPRRLLSDRGRSPNATRRLAALEGFRYLRHPAFLAGCALTVAYFLNTRLEPNGAYLGLIGVGAVGPGLGLLLAANMATLRPRADATEELLDVAPVTVAERTQALALATLWPAAAATSLVVISGTVVSLWSGLPVAFADGYADAWPTPVEIAQVPAFVVVCGVLGVTLGRWCPYRLASAATAIAAFFFLIPTFFWTSDGRLRYLAPLLDHSEVHRWVQVTPGTGHNMVTGFDRAGIAWHVAYLTGLGVLMVGLALIRHERSPLVNRLLVGGALLAALAGAAQLR